ncbi:MAG: 4'-phosphopantetheinyl transferase family protein [Micrococcaceae bacterium]
MASSADPVTLVWSDPAVGAGVLLVPPTGPGIDQRDRALAELAEVLDSAAELTVRHRCPRCGSDTHGTPSLVWGAGAAEESVPVLPSVSFSRARGWLALGFSATGRIGVDIEDPQHAAFADGGLDDAIFTPEEQQCHRQAGEHQRRQARLVDWVAKEALAKAAGVGFSADDPTAFTVTAAGDLVYGGVKQPGARLVPSAQWETPLDVTTVGLVGAVVVLPERD